MLQVFLNATLVNEAFLFIFNLIVNETVTHSICGISTKNSTLELPLVPGYPNYVSDCSVPRVDFIANLILGVNFGCALFLVNGDCAHQFLSVFYEVHDFASHRAELKKMVVILDSTELVPSLLTNSIILESLPHTLLLVPTNESVDLWTIGLVNDLEPSNRFLLRDWKFDKNEPILPIISDLKGMTVKISGINYRPYTAYYNTTPGEGNANLRGSNESLALYLDGYEFVLCLEFCRHFNCVLNLELEEEEFWGEIFDNRTGIGMFGDVLTRSSDITVGAFYRWRKPFEYTMYSKIMQQAAIQMLVPRPHLLPYYKTPILPFPAIVWLVLLLVYFVNVLVLYFFEFMQLLIFHLKNNVKRKRKGMKYAILTAFRSMVFEGTQYDPTVLSEFVLFGLLLFYSMIIGTLYSGGLASIMTTPRYEGQIDSIDALVHSELLWGGVAPDYVFSIQYTEQPLLRELIDGYKTYSLEECYRHAQALDMALVTETMQHGNLAFNDYIDLETSENLMQMAEDLYNEQTVVVSRKTWPFMYLMDFIILNVQQSGIGKFLEYNATLNTMDIRLQKNLHREIDKDAKIIPLEVDHILGALFLLGCGHVLAFLIFVLEILWAKRKKAKLMAGVLNQGRTQKKFMYKFKQ